MKISQAKSQLKNYTNHLLEYLRKEKYTPSIYNIWGADLADMQLVIKSNEEIGFSLCIIDFLIKFAWIIPLKDKKGITITNAIQKSQMNLTANEAKYRQMWKRTFVKDNGKKKKRKGIMARKNVIEMYSVHNEGRSVVAERFIKTLKIKIYKCMTSISKNLYIDKLDDIIIKYNHTYPSTIKMKPVEVKLITLMLSLVNKLMMEILNFYKRLRFTKKNCKKQIKKSLELKK